MQIQAVFYATMVKKELDSESFTVLFKLTRGVGTLRRQQCRRRRFVLSEQPSPSFWQQLEVEIVLRLAAIIRHILKDPTGS